MNAFENALDPSMRAALWDGPNTGIPAEACEIGYIVLLRVVLAFAKVGLNTIDERLLRTGDHEIDLIKIRVM